jgi:hypothetical protein
VFSTLTCFGGQDDSMHPDLEEWRSALPMAMLPRCLFGASQADNVQASMADVWATACLT